MKSLIDVFQEHCGQRTGRGQAGAVSSRSPLPFGLTDWCRCWRPACLSGRPAPVLCPLLLACGFSGCRMVLPPHSRFPWEGRCATLPGCCSKAFVSPSLLMGVGGAHGPGLSLGMRRVSPAVFLLLGREAAPRRCGSLNNCLFPPAAVRTFRRFTLMCLDVGFLVICRRGS